MKKGNDKSLELFPIRKLKRDQKMKVNPGAGLRHAISKNRTVDSENKATFVPTHETTFGVKDRIKSQNSFIRKK